MLISDNFTIQLPAAEGIGTIYVSVLIFRVNGIALTVGGINCVALAGHIAIPVRRQRHAIRYVLRAPLIGHLVHANIHIGAIIQLSVVKVALSILQASLCISCIVRVIQTALIEGGVGINLDGEANHQLLASPRVFLCIIDYRMAAIVKPADIDCLACNRDCNIVFIPCPLPARRRTVVPCGIIDLYGYVTVVFSKISKCKVLRQRIGQNRCSIRVDGACDVASNCGKDVAPIRVAANL